MPKGKPSSDGVRMRGRKGQAARARRLALHPLCAHCEAAGRVKATAIIDHIVPLAFGGLDVDENTQGLCEFCDAVKTAGEASGPLAAANHPDWLRPSAIPLTIVCGPPCAGKSTYVAEYASAVADIFIDLDAIAAAIAPDWGRRWNRELLDQAIRRRNAMLGGLSFASNGRAWLIVSAPSPEERAWWTVKLGGCLVLLDPGQAVCQARAMARDGRADHVARWYADARKPWARKRATLAKTGCDEDGYPIAPSNNEG